MAEDFAYYEILTDSDNILKDISRLLTLGIRSDEIIDSSGTVRKEANPIVGENWQVVYPAINRNSDDVNVDDWDNLLPKEYKAVTEDQINRIGDTVILKTTTIPKDVKANNSSDIGVNSDLNVKEISMYLEIYMPKYLCDSESDDPFTQRDGVIPTVIETNNITSGNRRVARNYHHVFMRIFDKLNEDGDGPRENVIDPTTRDVTTWNSRTSNWTKLSWYTDFEERFKSELLGTKSGMLDGILRVPVVDGLTKDTRIKIWANVNRSRVVLGVMGSPNVDFSDNRYLIGCAYIGQIESFDFSKNDTVGNFGIFTTSSTSPAMGKTITKVRPSKPAMINGMTVTAGAGAVGSGTRLPFASNLTIFNSGTVYNKQIMELTNIPYDYTLPNGGTNWGDRYVDTSTIRVYSTFNTQPDTVKYTDDGKEIIKSVGVQTSATFSPKVEPEKDDRTKITISLPLKELLTSLVGKSVANALLGGTKIQFGNLDVNGNFVPAVMSLTYNFSYYTEYTEAVAGVTRDKFGNSVSEIYDTTYGKNTATGITDFAMYATYTKDYFQKHFLYFASTEQYMQKELYGKSVYTEEYFADKIKIVHSSEGPRGTLGGMITIDTSSLNPFDELIINKDFEKYKDQPEETYVFLPITAPYCPFANSPNGRHGIGILKEYIYPVPTTDKEIVEFAIDELTKKYRDLDEVIEDFTLLEESQYKAKITWNSTNEKLINVTKEAGNNDGSEYTAKVTRPEFNEEITENPEVILTATVEHDGYKGEYQKKIRVRMQGMTDSKAVELDLKALDKVISKEVSVGYIDLPKAGEHETKIEWKSNDIDRITTDGKVTRPEVGESDVTVTLTAECWKHDAHQEKVFTITVKPWTLEQEMDDAYESVTWDLIKGDNTDSQAIISNLKLPSTVGQKNVTAKWSSDTRQLDAATGIVTRPTYVQGQVTVVLKCELSLGDNFKKTKTLPVYIISPLPITDKEAIDTAQNLLEISKFLGENKTAEEITTGMTLQNYIEGNIDLQNVVINWTLVDLATGKDTTSEFISITRAGKISEVKIKRPKTDTGNYKITLKATIGSNKETPKEKTFNLVILCEVEIPKESSDDKAES